MGREEDNKPGQIPERSRNVTKVWIGHRVLEVGEPSDTGPSRPDGVGHAASSPPLPHLANVDASMHIFARGTTKHKDTLSPLLGADQVLKMQIPQDTARGRVDRGSG